VQNSPGQIPSQVKQILVPLPQREFPKSAARQENGDEPGACMAALDLYLLIGSQIIEVIAASISLWQCETSIGSCCAFV